MAQTQPKPNQQKGNNQQGQQATKPRIPAVPSLHNSEQGANGHDKTLRRTAALVNCVGTSFWKMGLEDGAHSVFPSKKKLRNCPEHFEKGT
jgi:hypothetical protein